MQPSTSTEVDLAGDGRWEESPHLAGIEPLERQITQGESTEDLSSCFLGNNTDSSHKNLDPNMDNQQQPVGICFVGP